LPTTEVAPARYNAVAMGLHWLVAALILTNIGLAWYFGTLHGVAAIPPLQLHKSIGISVLILSVARLIWRFVAKPPRLPAYVAGWERWAAHSVYVLFYVVMLGMPLTGWAMVSASRLIHVFPITLFNIVPWPTITPLANLPTDQMHRAHDVFETAHGLLALLAYALIVLHVGAALRHLILLRDGVGARMIPFLRSPRTA
jgi:cytochrome b561